MELSKKTTILLSPELYGRLQRLALEKGVSVGHLVRSACEVHYGIRSLEDRLAAVKALKELRLPVGTPRQMKRQSVPEPQELLP